MNTIGVSGQLDGEVGTPEVRFGTRALRRVLLTIFPCRWALDLGTAQDDSLSASALTSDEEQLRLRHLGALEIPEIREALASYEGLHREEEARKSSAESRLTTVLGMSSIVSAITFGFVSVAFQTLRDAMIGWVGAAATVAFLYAVFQLVISVWHSVRGLQVRKISELTGSETLRDLGEAEKDFLLRRVRYYSEVVRDHDDVNSDKTKRLDLAHRAILNFLGAVLLLVTGLAVAAAASRTGDASKSLVEHLTANHVVVELLRGPKGDRGDVGPAGPAGPPAPAGLGGADGSPFTCPPGRGE